MTSESSDGGLHRKHHSDSCIQAMLLDHMIGIYNAPEITLSRKWVDNGCQTILFSF